MLKLFNAWFSNKCQMIHCNCHINETIRQQFTSNYFNVLQKNFVFQKQIKHNESRWVENTLPFIYKNIYTKNHALQHTQKGHQYWILIIVYTNKQSLYWNIRRKYISRSCNRARQRRFNPGHPGTGRYYNVSL